MAQVLVIGGSGLVGRALIGAWERLGVPVAATHFGHPFLGSRRLDLCDAAGLRAMLQEVRPAIVALPAANPFVDDCERHPQESGLLNLEGTRLAAQACRDIGARLIFFSSDYVFDGRKSEDYMEEDGLNPLNEYGRQKVAAEQEVLGSNPQNLIARCSAVYGWQESPKNFVLQVVSQLSRGETIRVAVDLLYKPTNADNLADICVGLAQKGAQGVYHVAGAERVSRFDFARRIAEAFGLDAGLIKPAAISEFGLPAARPRFSGLSTAKVRRELACEVWDVARGLAEMRLSGPAWRRRWMGVSPAA